ncbi:heterodisulfide reductase subunit B [Planktothrix sp. FACHB-1355]|uniref:Heterodisulfide reductase subunit B n=1 Tax=Aerosakkonema funiforme FACHB-1375 TaxID=2949571 RepID=A0A926ZGN7_9CYAN|nr:MULTISPECIES: heterodisulfide reductase-related iron-sulfur binding cluster [Oscillatoriales]MBD2180006.1 heterodisulfide reductase subunit B [Aerosakkonema funiforme FACHB-1375]MBD3560379.1 heterodisulfide reductase subunit B [Planktothrix sp. FACHB-1355]
MKVARENIAWERHQKQVPTIDDEGGKLWGCFRSCFLQSAAPYTEGIAYKILKNDLGMELREAPGHTSCGAIGYHGDVSNIETQMVVAARNFSVAHHELGVDNLFSFCVTSFANYTEMIKLWEEEPELREYTEKTLKETTGREFWVPHVSGGRPSVVHASDVFFANRHKLAAKAKYSLKGIKAVDHIGCHYGKIFPSECMGGAEFPQVLVGLLEAFGAEIVDYPERRHCCGMGFRQCAFPENRDYTASSVYKKMKSLKEAHPDCNLILTNCPGCTVFLDAEQGTIKEILSEEFNVSVLDYAQLTGLMLGYDPFKDCGLNAKVVQIEPLLDKIGIPYDKSKTPEQRRRPF